MRSLIILFAKAPQPGRVKTRLAAAIGDRAAVAVHTALVQDLRERLGMLAADADVEVHSDRPVEAWAVDRLQVPGDLGQRLAHAIEEGLAAGRPVVGIVGGDIPGLPPGHMHDLLADGADVTLGPAADGGYWGIACHRFHRAMFDGVRWSTPDALSDTVAACRACGLTVRLGLPWHDLDTVDDLERLPEKLRQSLIS